jgi:hypothetical protein
MRFRDRDAWIVAALSVVMWLAISLVLGGFGPITWIVAVLLFVGGVVRLDRTPSEAAAPDEAPAMTHRRSAKNRRKRSIYGPPD